MIKTDVCIVGAGPSGVCTSLMLSKLGISHHLIDKEEFPRDKTCGDGLILHVFKALKIIDKRLLEEFLSCPKFLNTNDINFYVSNDTRIKVREQEDFKHAPMFYGKRIDFDYFLLKKVNKEFTELHLGNGVVGVENSKTGVLLKLKDGKEILTKMVVGADGMNSIVSKKIGLNKISRLHTSTFVSAYYKGVKDLAVNNGAEIRIIYKKTPLFFYIFPLADGLVNISFGGNSHEIQKHKVQLKKVVEEVIARDAKIAPRFKNAERVNNWRGWGIPYSFGIAKNSGDRFMLVGDAAGLANAFYKEGVGTGMMSGVLCAQQIAKCIEKKDFSSLETNRYSVALEKEFGRLLRFSKFALRLTKYPRLFKVIILLTKSKIEKVLLNIIRKRSFSA